MPAITIDLSDEVFERLQQAASEAGIPLDRLIGGILVVWTPRRQTFDEAALHTLQKNAELYRRLAK